MNRILINIDVPDLKAATDFYQKCFSLKVGRKFDDSVVELLGLDAPIYLLKKSEGSLPHAHASLPRSYQPHWCPVHLDFVVPNLEETREKLLASGAIEEVPPETKEWGKIAMYRDPFGHGVCLIEFLGKGYDEISD